MNIISALLLIAARFTIFLLFVIGLATILSSLGGVFPLSSELSQ